MVDSAILVADLRSEQLRELQSLLLGLGLYSGAIDGIFGSQTRAAWQEFKRRNFLGQLEEIGPASLALLRQQAGLSDFREIDWTDGSQRISQFFLVSEVTKNDSRRIPVKNSEIERNILDLGKELDKIRLDWDNPILVTSWYRPEPVNRLVGGARNSTQESKRNFVAVSECKIAVPEVSYGEITRRGKTETVVVIDLPRTDRAAELWTQRKYLVSAARQLNLSRYVLFQVRGNRFGLAMIALEQPSRL